MNEASEREAMVEELQQLRESTVQAQEDLAYAINNPGQYHCPHCKLRSLLREATRCPRCHGTIDEDYWPPVLRREQERLEEQQRIAGNQRKAAEELERKSCDAEAERQRRFKHEELFFRFLLLYFLYLFPIVWFYSVIFKIPGVEVPTSPADAKTWIFIPAINWLVILSFVVSAIIDHVDEMLIALVIPAATGAALWVLTRLILLVDKD